MQRFFTYDLLATTLPLDLQLSGKQELVANLREIIFSQLFLSESTIDKMNPFSSKVNLLLSNFFLLNVAFMICVIVQI